MKSENLSPRVESLEHQVTDLKDQTGFVDHRALALEELAQLTALAETRNKEATEILKRYIPILEKWRKRGETAMTKLPNRGNFTDARALETLLGTLQDLSVRTSQTWADIASSLEADNSLENLPSIRLNIDRAHRGVLGIVPLRNSIRGLVANLETVITSAEE